MANHENLRKLFESKSGQVIVVHPVNTIRTQIVSTIRTLGFKVVNGTDEVSDVVRILGDDQGSGQPFWVITTLLAGEKSNALQLGKMIRDTPELNQTYWSVLVGSEDSYVVPLAIEQGALSWHGAEQFSAVDSIRGEIGAVIELAGKWNYNIDVFRLHYARLHLRNIHAYDMMIKLTSALVELMPINGECLFYHADALALNGEIEAAKLFATKAVWSENSISAQLPNLTNTEGQPLFSPEEIETIDHSKESILEAFGISKCVIVDPDSTARTHLRTAIENMGVKEISEFENGISAWEHVKDHHSNSILITEWKLPQLSGMALLQRLYQAGIMDLPVIISSAQLRPEDKGLIEELGNAVLLQKPLSLDDLGKNIRGAIKEENLPSTFKSLMRKVRSFLRQNDLTSARNLWITGSQEMLIPVVNRKVIDAEILFAEGNLEDAYVAALSAVKMGADGAHILNSLGKLAFALGDFEASAAWFNKANLDVAINIDRLTDLAEAHLHLENMDKATEAVANAEKIDAGNPKVVETKAMVALEMGDATEAASMMAQLNDLVNIVAHLNNRAVALAWKGEHDKGILLYHQALSASPKKKNPSQNSFEPFVLYNLALALARKGDLTKAEKVILDLDLVALASFDTRLSLKVGGFQRRVRHAIKNGSTLVVDTPKTSEVSKKRIQNLKKSADSAETTTATVLKKLNIFGNIDYRALKMVEKPLKFGFKKL